MNVSPISPLQSKPMDSSPLAQHEILIRYGRLAPYARDRVLDQFNLMTGSSHGSTMLSRLATLFAGSAAVLIPVIGPMILLVRFMNMRFEDMMFIIYGTIIVLQLCWFLFMLSRRTRRRYKEVPLQTTELGLSATHLKVHSRYIHGGCVKASMRWQDISSIQCIERTAERSSIEGQPMQEIVLEMIDANGKKIELQLDCIQTIEERQILRDCIFQFVPHIDVKSALSGLLRIRKTDNVPFTKLWSQALQDASPRLNTAPLEPDSLLQNGRFVIRECIGSGGQGAVYQTDMRELDGIQSVVLKEYVLPDITHAQEHKESVEQFEKEVRLLSKINHSGVIKLHDAFVEDHRAYLVLEQVNGISIRDYIAKHGLMQPERVVMLGLQMCDILDALHSMNPSIMHLDFSPENILIANDHLTVIDFNISVEENSLRTRTVMGKQRYMAPEQYRGKPSVRSDIYSMGATLFFMLTGIEPEPITVSRPSTNVSGMNEQLESIVVRATSLEEEARFQSANELRQALSKLSLTIPLVHAEKGESMSTSIPEKTVLKEI